MRTTRTLSAWIVVFLATQTAWSQPLADKLPENALLYVGWAGRTAAFDGSTFGQFLQQPGTADLMGRVHKAVSIALKDDPAKLALFQRCWSMTAIACQHPAAAVLLEVKPAAAGKPPLVQAALVIDLGKDKAAFDEPLQALLKMVAPSMTSKTSGGVTYSALPTPAGEIGIGYVGELLFVALGAPAADAVIAAAGGKGKTLAGNARFAAAMKEVSTQALQLGYFLDVARVYDAVDAFLPPGGGAAPGAAAAGAESQFRKIIKALGLGGVTTVAGAGNVEGKDFYCKCRVASPGPHRGVLSLLAGAPLGKDALAGAPADTAFLCALNLDPAKLLAEAKRVATELEPQAGKIIDGALAMVGSVLDVDLEKDLLANMGDQWTVISAPSLGGFLTGTVLTCQLKDAAKFSLALTKVENFLQETVLPGAGALTGQVVSCKFDKVEVRYVKFTKAPIPVAPAWAIANGRFYLAAFPQVVAAAVQGTNEKPLAELPEFAALRRHVSPNAAGLAYANPVITLRQMYMLPLMLGPMLGNVLPPEYRGLFSADLVPPLPAVEKVCSPLIWGLSSDEKGITFESYGALPAGPAMLAVAPGQAALAVSIALPALERARTQARQASSLSTLNGIGRGCALYMAENNDKFPPDLPALVQNGSISPRMLMSPSSGREVRMDAIGKRPIEPFDYVYIGRGMPADAPPDLVLAYERPEINGNEGTCVLYTALHVRWLPMSQFQKELAKTQEYLAKKAAKP